jgi:hypothetical protein
MTGNALHLGMNALAKLARINITESPFFVVPAGNLDFLLLTVMATQAAGIVEFRGSRPSWWVNS